MKYKYKIVADPSYIPSILIYVYVSFDNVSELYPFYGLIFTKFDNVYICLNPDIPLNIQEWLIKNKIIEKLPFSAISLTSKALLEVL